jgi:bifunctional non-homologous end joining protein LigD
LARSRPVTYFAFDLLYLDGYDLRRVPLIDRKRALEAILTPTDVLRYSEHFAGAGQQMLEAAGETGVEGILAKRANSFYEPRRSREWLKLKVVSQQEFLICGFTEGERDYFSSLVLGYHENGRLLWAGNVGTGFDQKMLANIYRRLEPLIVPRSPFAETPKMLRHAIWVRPELVCMIRFTNWTQDNRLRAPVFLGLRADADPKEVFREKPEQPQERRKVLLSDSKDEASLRIDDKPLKFTNLNKVFYPEEGYTKRDVLNYYDAVADLILPYLKDRPLSLKRYPNGIHEEFFFQKDVPQSFASWLRTELIDSEERRGKIRYVFAEDRASLLYLVNLACIDHNPWMSRFPDLDHPDFILIDLDPQECSFDRIVEAAQLVRKKLDAIGLEGCPKTTGGDGLHIYIPVEPVYTYEEVRSFAEILARLLTAERPDLFTTPRSVSRREKGKVYFDYLQNAKSKTISAPYVLRAYPGAPVATPLRWEEVKEGLLPTDFTIRNAVDRFMETGDLFAPVLTNLQTIEEPLEKMAR